VRGPGARLPSRVIVRPGRKRRERTPAAHRRRIDRGHDPFLGHVARILRERDARYRTDQNARR
jgi:hypothetical protein